MLKTCLAALLAAQLAVLGAAGPAAAAGVPMDIKPPTDPGPSDPAPSDPAPQVGAGSGEGSVVVTVTTSGSTVEGRSFSSSTTRTQAPVCWYGRGMSGLEYFEYWKPGGEARESDTLDDFAYQGLLHPDYESHATDDTGHWYEATCRVDAPVEVREAYLASHPAVFVPAGVPAPPVEAQVPPEVLAEVAYEAMQLPTGVIRWNPATGVGGATVVNLDTWVWVEGAPVDVEVTASVPSGVWARVSAHLAGMELTAQGADPVSCSGAGTAWSAGAGASSCSLVFYRSTAGLAVKDGQALPTATVTAAARWEASWTSSVDATPRPLDAQTITATAEIPVAEIQTLVTTG